MSKRSLAAQSTSTSGSERREDFRLIATMGVRLRPITPETTDLGASNLVEDFEELSYASAAYRTELSAAGRKYLDSLMATVETLVGKVQKPRAVAGWSPAQVLDVNLSNSGCGFNWVESISEGEQIELELAPGGETHVVPFHTEATVVRCVERGPGEYSIGLRFDDVGNTKAQRLRALIYAMQRAHLRQSSGTA